jgi:hypothetical protein
MAQLGSQRPSGQDVVRDEDEIRGVIETWVIARDSGLWDRLRGTWHPGGRMNATWFQGDAIDFVDASRRSFESGVLVHHALGGSMIDIVGHRAIAQSKVTISVRILVDGADCDVLCTGRFYDFFEHRDGRWGIVVRQPIYEKDRVDPVEPGVWPAVDHAVLEQFPPGCRWLLYAQSRAGLPVIPDQPQLRGKRVAELYAAGTAWLKGASAAW